jgi:hypothetical protein
MRLTLIAAIVILFASPSAFAQQHPYDLDPYKPSDAALLRNYGSVLVGLTPLLELRRLDPYVPSQAALLRQLGGALPLWVGWYPPVPVPAPAAPLTPFAGTTTPQRPASNITVIIVSPRDRQPPRQLHRIPLPQPPVRVATGQAAQNAARAGIHVECDSAECRWRIRDMRRGSDTSERSACGWMPKGGPIESGGERPCDRADGEDEADSVDGADGEDRADREDRADAEDTVDRKRR